MNKESSQLRRGKAFHKLIQNEWEREAEGEVQSERHICKPNVWHDEIIKERKMRSNRNNLWFLVNKIEVI